MSLLKQQKGQAWDLDFILAMVLFIVVVLVFFEFYMNFFPKQGLSYNDLKVDAKIIANQLMVRGYPFNWTSTNVSRIGITNSDNRINESKVAEFASLDYDQTRTLLGTSFDYFVYFQQYERRINETGLLNNLTVTSKGGSSGCDSSSCWVADGSGWLNVSHSGLPVEGNLTFTYHFQENLSQTMQNVSVTIGGISQTRGDQGFSDGWYEYSFPTLFPFTAPTTTISMNSSCNAGASCVGTSKVTVDSYRINGNIPDEHLVSIGGVCGIGSPEVVINITSDAAYYWNTNSVMRDEMIDLGADLYSTTGDINGDLNDLLNNASKYGFILFEDPEFSTADLSLVQPVVSNTMATTFMVGSIRGTGNYNAFSVQLKGVSSSGTTTIIAEDSALPFRLGENMSYNGDHTCVWSHIGALNYVALGNYSGGGSCNSHETIASWDYGRSRIYYFGRMNATYQGKPTIEDELKEGAANFITTQCGDPVFTMESEHLAKIVRLPIYESDTVAMVLLVWT
ncbi:hypothetical protein HYW21_00110 [Candidatus Woesearchaeota archaeon]|nr:hypothetical protein [Candidatus Woesearchaeota archaeon]